MNMKMNMEPIWSILKMIGYFLMDLLVWIGKALLHVTIFPVSYTHLTLPTILLV